MADEDQTHFGIRCRERGIDRSDTNWLWHRLVRSIDRRDSFTDLAKATDTSQFWRFRCWEGTFYAVTKAGSSLPVTVYTQEMFKDMKRRIKLHKKGRKRMTTVRRLNRF